MHIGPNAYRHTGLHTANKLFTVLLQQNADSINTHVHVCMWALGLSTIFILMVTHQECPINNTRHWFIEAPSVCSFVRACVAGSVASWLTLHVTKRHNGGPRYPYCKVIHIVG